MSQPQDIGHQGYSRSLTTVGLIQGRAGTLVCGCTSWMTFVQRGEGNLFWQAAP